MKLHVLFASVLLAAPTIVAASEPGRYAHARVEHAPAPAIETGASEQGMVIYTDPETGEWSATPPAGVRAAEFPELRFDPAAVAEESRADGTVITWLNGAGIEAQILTTSADGQHRVTCSSVLETARKVPDLRQASLQGGARDER